MNTINELDKIIKTYNNHGNVGLNTLPKIVPHYNDENYLDEEMLKIIENRTFPKSHN